MRKLAMKRVVALFALLTLLFFWSAGAKAQFADQATNAGVGGGTANAQTITLPNALTLGDVQGVLLKYIPNVTNLGAATLTVNSLTPTAFRRVTSSGLAALSGGELQSGQPVVVFYDGTFFDILSATTTNTGALNLLNSALNFSVPVNLQINATVSANALTVAIVGNNGSVPSTTNPILTAFRDATIANGDPVVVSVTSALSITVSSGNTMGCVSGVTCRIRIYEINNGGTVAICLYNSVSTTNITGINEANLQTSASGTTGGSSAQTLYCSTSAVSNKAVREIGYIDIQEATAGTWATGPTFTQLMGPGVKRAGDIVQVRFTASTGTITPTSAANLVKASVSTSYEPQTIASQNTNLQRNGSIIATIALTAPSTTAFVPLIFSNIVDTPSSTSSTTYTINVPTGVLGTIYIELEEIMAANDNGQALSAVG